MAFAGKKDYDTALADLNQAIELAPDQPETWNLRGIVNGRKKNYDKAIQDYTRAIQLAPKGVYYSNRGIAYGNKKMSSEAHDNFNEAINRGYTAEATWVRFALKRGPDFPRDFFLRLAPLSLDHLTGRVQSGPEPSAASSYQMWPSALEPDSLCLLMRGYCLRIRKACFELSEPPGGMTCILHSDEHGLNIA